MKARYGSLQKKYEVLMCERGDLMAKIESLRREVDGG
jgi:hypothetical protein